MAPLRPQVRALLFWERFFLLYFSAQKVEPGFFPPAKQTEANDHFGRIARMFESTDRRVYMLYECFTTCAPPEPEARRSVRASCAVAPSTVHISFAVALADGASPIPFVTADGLPFRWSEEIIPRRGAFFTPGSINTDGNEHFISIITAAHPPPYVRLRSASGGVPGGSGDASSSGWGQQLALTSLQPLQLTMRPPSAETGEEPEPAAVQAVQVDGSDDEADGGGTQVNTLLPPCRPRE